MKLFENESRDKNLKLSIKFILNLMKGAVMKIIYMNIRMYCKPKQAGVQNK